MVGNLQGDTRDKTDCETQFWLWRGYRISYQTRGDRTDRDLPAAILIHGFGASLGHWRKNMEALAEVSRVFAIDLIGFGAADKPTPGQEIDYTFETWGTQIVDFCREVVGSAAILVGNSIGAIVAMQAAVLAPELASKVIAIDCSLRLLQEQKQLGLPWYKRLAAKAAQQILGNRAIAQLFFDQVRKPSAVRKILSQAYARSDAVTDELVDMLIEPARDPGAMDVFMAFVRYSQGPTPEELLANLPCQATLLWGEQDPWEPIALGRELAKYDCVKEFIAIADAGHCPQDEAPEMVNPILVRQIQSLK
ncbi:alpha/beta fold hydrolase [Pseudanabaena sp. PCC 6802]|uniref:alpha/beta fold hydrolase n=1 Tax=Pseudanabaena sp. PCC 6802 TaxID=118173 RepID=UPI000347F9EC|nr:alpha/beta fold hydrolase [Pseudanabaena sp. PCC 6802]